MTIQLYCVVKEKKILLSRMSTAAILEIYPFDHFHGVNHQRIIHKIGFKASS